MGGGRGEGGDEGFRIKNIHLYFPGIWRDKTMEDILMYIPNDNKQNYTIVISKLLVEKFRHSLLSFKL